MGGGVPTALAQPAGAKGAFDTLVFAPSILWTLKPHLLLTYWTAMESPTTLHRLANVQRSVILFRETNAAWAGTRKYRRRAVAPRVKMLGVVSHV